MKNPDAYHEYAVRLANELYPDLLYEIVHGGKWRSKETVTELLNAKVTVIERHLRALMEPVEAAANHDISQHETIESTVRAMAHRIIDLEGYMRQNAQ